MTSSRNEARIKNLPPVSLPKDVKNWDQFQRLLEAAATNQRRERILNKGARYTGEKLVPEPLRGYKIDEIQKLAEIVGKKNRGIRFRPDWNSELSAKEWIDRQKAKDPDNPKWEKWGVDKVDLDDNELTPDNVVVFSNKEAGRIKAIDGHEIVPRNKKETLRALYSDFPTREHRARIDPKERSRLKAYYRKYPTETQQEHHPIDEFVKEKSAFNMVKETVQIFLNMIGFSIYSKEKHPNGTVKLTKFMTLLQKLTSQIYKGVLREVLSADYDETEIKSAAVQRRLRRVLSENDN